MDGSSVHDKSPKSFFVVTNVCIETFHFQLIIAGFFSQSFFYNAKSLFKKPITNYAPIYPPVFYIDLPWSIDFSFFLENAKEHPGQ